MENNPEQSLNQQSPLPQQPISSISQPKSKFKILLLIIISVLIAGGGVYLLGTNKNMLISKYFQKPTPTSIPKSPTPIPNSTANWKIYKNEKYGFEIKYPENIFSEVDFKENASIGYKSSASGHEVDATKLIFKERLSKLGKKECCYKICFDSSEICNVKSEPGIELFSVDKPLEELISNFEKSDWQITVAGVKAIGYDMEAQFGGGDYYYVPLNKNQTLIIIRSYVDNAPNPKVEIFNQMLSTFRFIDQNQDSGKYPLESDISNARNALINYFDLLNEKQYVEAIKYHGSGYDYLYSWNPGTDKNDHVSLIESGCENNGLNCLKIKAVLNQRQVSSIEFEFTVQFAKNDGSLFKRGPCCGATEEQMPTKTDFRYVVKKENNDFLVMQPPTYTP